MTCSYFGELTTLRMLFLIIVCTTEICAWEIYKATLKIVKHCGDVTRVSWSPTNRLFILQSQVNSKETKKTSKLRKFQLFVSGSLIDPSHKSQNASVPYPTMQRFVTEMCTHVHIPFTKWCIVGYLPGALWDLWEGSIDRCARIGPDYGCPRQESNPHLHQWWRSLTLTLVSGASMG